MYDRDVYEMIGECRKLIYEVIKKELLNYKEKRVELHDCSFASESLDDMLVVSYVTSVYLKNDDIWIDFHDEYSGEHSMPILECLTVTEMLDVMDGV